MRDRHNFNVKEEKITEEKITKKVEFFLYRSYYENNRYFSHLYKGIITFYKFTQTSDNKNAFILNHLLIILVVSIMVLRS